MKVLISSLLRKLAVEFVLTQKLKPWLAKVEEKYGKKDIKRNAPGLFEKIKKDFVAMLDEVKGHGLSEEKYDNIIGEIEKLDKRNAKVVELIFYASNLILAGAGEKVIKAQE